MSEFKLALLQIQSTASLLGLTLAIGRVLELRASDDALVFETSDLVEMGEVVLQIAEAHMELGLAPGSIY
jgi:hypothetical protein